MPIYTGGSADGWDMREAKGMYVSPDGNQWSNIPYTDEERAYDKAYNAETRMIRSISHKIKTFEDLETEYQLILQKKSNFSVRQRQFIVSMFDEVDNI